MTKFKVFFFNPVTNEIDARIIQAKNEREAKGMLIAHFLSHNVVVDNTTVEAYKIEGSSFWGELI